MDYYLNGIVSPDSRPWDLRGHGLNCTLLDDLRDIPPGIDVLLMEGTIIGEREDEFFQKEADLEADLIKICKETQGPVFISAPSQNIDRMISIARAAKCSGRKFLIDLYSAELFDRLQSYSEDIPHPEDEHILLWYPFIQREIMAENNLFWVMKKFKRWKCRLKDSAPELKNAVILLRPAFRGEIGRHLHTNNSVWIYSMWKGYLNRSEPLKRLKQWTEDRNIPFIFLHTSGHAKLADLQRVANNLSPKKLIPIHSVHTDQFAQHFENVCLVRDGEIVDI